MNAQRLRHPARPLLAFGDALGIPPGDWVQREGLTALSYSDPELSRETAAALTLDQLTPLVAAYGDALTCRFLLGDLPVLTLGPGLDEEALATFRDKTRLTPTVALDLRLDKMRLVENWLGDSPDCRAFLYLFPQALQRLLAGDLGRLESRLWGADPACKVLLLAPDHEIWLDGPYLAVLGGDRIADWRAALPAVPPDAERVGAMYQVCRDTLKWGESWLRHLTPLHLQVEGSAAPDDPIANALAVHLTDLIALYTADRTVSRPGGRLQATYAGARQSVQLTLGDPGELLGDDARAGVRPLLAMLEWTYEPIWAADRLPLVQVGVVGALHAAKPAVRYRLLLLNAASIFEGLKWHWKAFIEGRVDAYAAQVRALEDYVAETVTAFSDQISAMVKSLSEAMLAAVAALLGSFIAALFKDEFNPTIFRIGMLVYAVYVTVFPLGYNMLNQWGRYRALVDDFAERRRRFEARLYPQQVGQIVGSQVAESQTRFQHWFVATAVAYGAVIVLAVLAAALLPDVAADVVATPAP